MYKLSRENSFYIILFALIFSLVGGSVLFDFTLFGIHFYGYRLAVIMGILYLIVTKQLVLYSNRYELFVGLFLLFWLVTAIFSLFWCPDVSAGLKEIIYLSIGSGTYFLLLSLSKKMPDFQVKFASIWKIVFWVLIVFCINEILTKSHLASSFTESIEKFGVAHKINAVPTFSFDNPNHLAVYLVLSIAILAFYYLKENNFYTFYFPFLFACGFLFLIESRLSFLAVFCIAILSVIFRMKQFSQWFKHSSLGKKISLIIVLVCTLTCLLLLNYRIGNDDNKINHYVLIDKNIADSLRNLGAQHKPSSDVVLHMHKKLADQIQEPKASMDLVYRQVTKQGSIWQECKWLFPLSMFIILLLASVLLFYKRNHIWKPFVSISALGLLLFVGIFSKHNVVRVNEKWKNHAIVQSVREKTNTFSNAELDLTPVSVQYETAEAFQKGKMLSLVALDPNDGLIQQSQSTFIRRNLYEKGWNYLKSSKFLGMGAGSYSVLASRDNKMDNLALVTSPHSLLIEIFAQYGVVIGLFFILLLLFPILLLLKQFFDKQFSTNSLLLCLAMICFVIMSHSNSASLPLPVIWVNFSLVVILTGYLLSPINKKL